MPNTVKASIPIYDNLPDLFASGFGAHREFFFQDNSDWSKILIFFNGAVSPSQRRNGHVYQRWTWAEMFRHPVVIISDPSTYGEKGLNLGWYVGRRDDPYLSSALDKIDAVIRRREPAPEIVAFGSSAGGFAALRGLQLGYFDTAIVVNPQTDIELYPVKNPMRRFLDWYGSSQNFAPQAEDRKRLSLIELGFNDARNEAQIIYVQNTADHIHLTQHMVPYEAAVQAQTTQVRFVPILFNNPGIGHNPPLLRSLTGIIGEPFKSLLKSSSSEQTQKLPPEPPVEPEQKAVQTKRDSPTPRITLYSRLKSVLRWF